MMKVNIPVGPGNKAAKAGKLGTTIQAILAELKPEAAYFFPRDGERGGFLSLICRIQSPIRQSASSWG